MLTPLPGQVLPTGKWCQREINFLCQCGRTTSIPWRRYKQFAPKTCNDCRYSKLDHKEVVDKLFGKLIVLDIGGSSITQWSHRFVKCRCVCGNICSIRFSHIFSGAQTSCGKCNYMPTEWWDGKLFGRLKLKKPVDLHTGSDKKITWICLCGGEVDLPPQFVTYGKTLSCGKCSERIKDWYVNNAPAIRKLKYPIQPHEVPDGGIKLISTATGSLTTVAVECYACKSIYNPRFGDIKAGKSLTYGCSTNRVSKGHLEVKKFIESLGFEVINEYKLFNFRYDMYVPDAKCLVEFNGTKWHNSDKVKKRDNTKYYLANENGYRLMFVIDDDWTKCNEISKQRIKDFILMK